MSWWKMDFCEPYFTTVIYYLTSVCLSPSSSWPLCKVFSKANNTDCLGTGLRMLCTAQCCVLESLGLHSLPRKHHSLAFIRARAQGVNVELDSHDSSGHWEGQGPGMFWEDFWTTVWTQSSSSQAAVKACPEGRMGGSRWFSLELRNLSQSAEVPVARDQLCFVMSKLRSCWIEKALCCREKIQSKEKKEAL